MARTKHRSRTTADPLRLRLRSLRQQLRNEDVSALLVTNPVDIRYLTGFIGDDSWALVTAGRGRIYILSDFRFQEQIAREAPQVTAILRQRSLADELPRLCRRLRIKKIAISRDHVTLATRKALVKRLGASSLGDLDDPLIGQRSCKDAGEVRAIGKALAIQQKAFQETCQFIRPGMTEIQVCAYLEYRMRSLGADGSSFPTIVAVDANASLPHAVPGRRKIKVGSMVLIDWGARWQGYCSDLTRVVSCGRMKPKLRELYSIVLDAQRAAIDTIAAGKRLKDIDLVARGIITRAGYGEWFGHGLGHGIGLDIHEQPVLARRANGELKPGHVVTVEPGIYLPGLGGIRIEDDVLVTERGHKVLSDLPKSLESTMI